MVSRGDLSCTHKCFLKGLALCGGDVLEKRIGATECGVNYCNCVSLALSIYIVYVPICFTCSTDRIGKALSAKMDQNNNKKAGPLSTAPGGNGVPCYQGFTGNAKRVNFPTAKQIV